MVTNRFSTGLPKLDQHVGGILPGNSLLIFRSDIVPVSELFYPLARWAQQENITIVYLSVNNSLSDNLTGQKRLRVWSCPKTFKSPLSILNAITRFVSSQSGKVCVVTDDLSAWKDVFRNEKHVQEVVGRLSTLVERKKSFFICSALRSAFSTSILAHCKEQVTICVDMFIQQQHCFFIPLSVRHRYLSHGAIPFQINLKEFRKPELKPDQPILLPSHDEQTRELSVRFEQEDRKFEKMFEDVAEAMIVFDLKGDYRMFNVQFQRFLGRTREDIQFANLFSVVVPEHKIRLMRFFVELRTKKKSSVILDLKKSDRKTIPVEFHCSQVGNSMYLGILRDYSVQHALEAGLRESADAARTLLLSSRLAIMVVSKAKIIFANEAVCNMFGFSTHADICALPLKSFFVPQALKKLQGALRGSDPATGFEIECIRQDGSAVYCFVTIADITYYGKDSQQISFLDITSRKHAEATLVSSNERYRTLVDSSGEAAGFVVDGSIRFANRALLQLFGLTESTIDAVIPMETIFPPPGVQRLSETIEKLDAGRKNNPVSIIMKGLTSEKKELDLLAVVHPRSANGLTLLYVHDHTQKKSEEKAIQRHRRDFELLKEIIASSTGTLDLQKLLRIGVDKILEVLHWEMGAMYLLDAKKKEFQLSLQVHFPERLASTLSSLPLDEGLGGLASKTQEPHLIRLDRYPSYLPYKSLFKEHHIARICLLPLIALEKPVGLMLICAKNEVSIDEQSVDLLTVISRQMGNALDNALAYQRIKKEEEQYQSLVESSPDVMYTALPNGSFIFISPQVTQLTGYPPKEFYRNSSLWLSLIHADDKKIVLGRTAHLEEIQEKIINEYRVIPKGKASPKWVRDEISLKRDEKGVVTAVTGVVSDVTRSREIVEQMHEKTKRDSAIFSSITEGVIVFNRQLKCVVWNHALAVLTGYGENVMINKGVMEIPIFTSVDTISNQLRRVLDGEVVVFENIPFTKESNGTKAYFSVRFAPLKDGHHAYEGIVGVLTETTDRVETKSDIKATEQVLTNVIDTMDDILIITDLKGTIIQVNKSFLRVLGYTRSEAIGYEFPYSWLIDEEMSRFVLWIANLRERNWLHDFDMTWRAKDGHLIPMSLSTTLLRNSLGEPIAMLNIARDITERTRLAKDLETRSKQIELINRIISTANQTNDFDEVFTLVTEEVQKIIPADTISIGLLTDNGKSLQVYAMGGIESLKKGDIIPVEQTVSQFAISSQKPVVISDLAMNPKYSALLSLSKGLRSQISLPIILKGKPFGTLNIGSREPHTFTDEHANILLPLAQQIGTIIDRIHLFKRVTEDSAYIRNLLDSIDSIVYTVDTRCRILEVNKAWHEFMKENGVAYIREYQGLNLFEVLPSDPLKIIFQNVVDQLMNGTVRIFSQEYVHHFNGMERIYQLTINPMVIDRRITGLVFTHTDITALKITEKELKKSNEQLLALNEISSLISTSFNLQDILKAAIPLLKNTLEATAVLVYLIERPSLDLYLAEQIGLDIERFSSIIRLRQKNSATGIVIETKEALYISEKAYSDERIIPQNREVLRQGNIEAMAVIPLVSKDKVLGALDIFYTGSHVFYRQEQQMLELIGNQLGSTIENAQLYSELRSQIDRLTVLYELSQELTSTLDIEQIFHAVFQNIQHIIPFERFSIEVYDPGQKTLTPAYVVETVKGEKTFVHHGTDSLPLLQGSPEASVIEMKRPFQTDDKRSIYVPMQSKEMTIGIMSIQSSWVEEYTETHLRLLESIGNLTALALEKGKLYEETVQKSKEIQQRNKELDDFTYVVSHDLKEPLISIEGFSRILQVDYNDVIQQEGKEYLESIVGATTRMKGLIDDLLMLSRVSRPSESFKPVSLVDVIHDITTDMEFTIKQKGVDVAIAPNLPTIIGNETQLKLVFRNLIANAVKFNKKSGPKVEIGFRNAENNSYLFHVKDNGIGIDPEFHEKIFVIFQRLHRREDYEGSGAGLAIVKKIIEIHGGKIWVESQLGEGATFYFTISKFIEA